MSNKQSVEDAIVPPKKDNIESGDFLPTNDVVLDAALSFAERLDEHYFPVAFVVPLAEGGLGLYWHAREFGDTDVSVEIDLDFVPANDFDIEYHIFARSLGWTIENTITSSAHVALASILHFSS